MERATVDVPGQKGANITMCAAIANAGLLLQRCHAGPYNTFLNDLHLVPEQDQEGENMRTFVITWDKGKRKKKMISMTGMNPEQLTRITVLTRI